MCGRYFFLLGNLILELNRILTSITMWWGRNWSLACISQPEDSISALVKLSGNGESKLCSGLLLILWILDLGSFWGFSGSGYAFSAQICNTPGPVCTAMASICTGQKWTILFSRCLQLLSANQDNTWCLNVPSELGEQWLHCKMPLYFTPICFAKSFHCDEVFISSFFHCYFAAVVFKFFVDVFRNRCVFLLFMI